MKNFKFLIVTFLAISLHSVSQTPSDFLSKEFHKERREILRSKMVKNSVSVVFANPIRNRANDVDYVFHQDPNFYYLTGYREPNAVLVLFSDNQTDENGAIYNEILYVQKRDKRAEQWSGKRLGVKGAKNELGFKMAMNAEDFVNATINFKKFDQIYIEKFNDDYRNSLRNKSEVYDLVNSFKEKSGYNDIKIVPQNVENVRKMIANVPDKDMIDLVRRINKDIDSYPDLKKDKLIMDFLSAKDDNQLE